MMLLDLSLNKEIVEKLINVFFKKKNMRINNQNIKYDSILIL